MTAKDNTNHKENVLIVDDDESIRTTLSYILEDKGFSVDTVRDGTMALEKICYKEYSLALLDYKLPDTDGVSLAKKIKREARNIEVIILTGKATMESAIDAVKEDIFDYLLKPVDPDELIKVIGEALDKQRLIKKNQELMWELKKKNREMEKLNKFKSGLISMLSHDLRSPMSSLKGFNESFLQGFLGDLSPRQKEVIQTENRVLDSMMELINSLLDMEQIEAGQLRMNKKPCFIIKDVMDPVLERLGILADKKNIDIRVNCGKSLPEIEIDPNRISQVLQNILQNALKFTPENGYIDVSVSEISEGGKIEVRVKDSGKGIASHELNSIFDSFYTQDGETEPYSAGRGLGLTICKEIIKAHDGVIWAESDGENKGSSFIFILPVNGAGKEYVKKFWQCEKIKSCNGSGNGL